MAFRNVDVDENGTTAAKVMCDCYYCSWMKTTNVVECEQPDPSEQPESEEGN